MRADRLLSILMLLQGRGRMTAQQLAAELEVSERTRTDYPVLVRVAPDFAAWSSHYLGESSRTALAQADPPDPDGWIVLELRFENLWSARDRILSFGRGVEVLEPRALRLSVLDYAAQIVDLYGNANRS
jgi:predicted DNA-binding transcriptional regulator YafY